MNKTEENEEGQDRDAQLILGIFHAGELNFEKALYCLNSSYKQGSLRAGYYIGCCYAHEGDYIGARSQFEEIMKQCTSDDQDRETKKNCEGMLEKLWITVAFKKEREDENTNRT